MTKKLVIWLINLNMFAVKDFWKFQGASEDDIGLKYQTSKQRRNFQKDLQPEWVAVTQALMLRCSSVTDFISICSLLAPHLRTCGARNKHIQIYEPDH